MFLRKALIVSVFLLLEFSAAFAKQKTISTIKANEMEASPDKKVLSATGDVELIQGQKILYADKVIYNKENAIIEAEGSVKMSDKLTGSSLFAEKTKVKDSINWGEFHNAGIIFENGSSIIAPKITKESEYTFILQKPKYFVCPTELNFDLSYEEILEQTFKKKRKLFAIKSSKLNVDQKEKILRFKHAFIQVWGAPVFYLPYLRTGHPFGERQTGFSAPKLESNSNYGYGVFLPYYIRISKNKNLTLTPGVYEDGNNLVRFKYNQTLQKNGFIKLYGNIVNDNDASKNILNTRDETEEEEGKYQDTRGHGHIIGSYEFNPLWSTFFDGTMVSDDYLLRDYEQNYSVYLESFADFDRINKNDYNLFEFKTLFYQEIREERLNQVEQTPQYVPLINSHLETNRVTKKDLRLTYNLDSNATVIHRTTGRQYERATFIPSIENIIIKRGNIFKAKLNLRNDFYFIDENYREPDSNEYDKTESRVIPGFEFEWRFPVIKNYTTTKWVVEPVVKYMIDSDQESFENDDIPNEDSQAAEISYSNMFAHNRYGGYDRTEYGNRISYGIKSELYNKKYGILNFMLAQGYRDENDVQNQFEIRGFDEDFSDVVGKASYETEKIFDIYYRFRLDRTTFTGKSNELTNSFDFGKFRLFSTYAMLKAEKPNEERQEQLTYGIDIRFIRKWLLTASSTKDFVNRNRTINKKFGIYYDGPCTSAELLFKEYTPRSKKRADRTIKFNFSIKSYLF